MSKAELWRSYGFPTRPPSGLIRYKSNERKSILWVLTSRYVRMRDWRKYGTCISCGGKIEHWKDGDAGHYAPASSCGVNLLFSPRNVNLECSRCNAFDEGHLIGYRKELIKREGLKAVEELEREYEAHKRDPGTDKEFSQSEYHEKIIALQALMKAENMLE